MKNVKDWIRENDVILRAFSLLMAIALWAYVMNTDDVDRALPYEDIPVRLEGVTTLKESGLVVMSGTNETVSVKASGKGSLVLEDPNEPLTCGIEIRVQPPGKQVKTITLLSGGEKAFVATALYFAILKVRQSYHRV